MRRILLHAVLLLFLTTVFQLTAKTAFAQLTVFGGMTPQQLVDTLVGAGVTVSNVTYTGAANSKGRFRCINSCNLGISNGIMMSSGNVFTAAGPNVSGSTSGAFGTPGDVLLNQQIAPLSTWDAAVLEFDFVVTSDSVQFRYVFGSEEYPEWVCNSFFDVFGFFITGPNPNGAAYVDYNMALIPGTTLPVGINSVNPGVPGSSSGGGLCNLPNQSLAYSQYYVDNTGGTTVEFDGFTTVLTAAAKVCACQVYHMKLAIADASDQIYDSGVFLESNSFESVGQIPIYANGVVQPNAATFYICPGDSVQLCLDQACSYDWSTGDTTQCIWVSTNGNYAAYVSGAPGCFAWTTTVSIQVVPPVAVVNPPGPIVLCPGQNVVLTSTGGGLTYQWSNGETTQNISVSSTGNYFVTITYTGGCSATSNIVAVNVGSAIAGINPSGPLTFCQGGNVTLTSNPATTYQWSTGATTQSINVGQSGSYILTVTQAGCTDSAIVNVVVNPLPTPAIAGNLSFCNGSFSVLDAGAGYSNYLWTGGSTNQTLNVTASGIYAVTVTDGNGCTATTNVNVQTIPNPAPVIAGPASFCQGSNGILDAGAGYTGYLWSTGATTQTIPVSASGAYTVTVSDANSCTGSSTHVLTVNALPTPSIAGNLSFCQNSSSVLDAGAGYASYQWSTGAVTQTISVSTAGTFTVTVTDGNGCIGSTNVIVNVNALPTPAIAGNLVFCDGLSSVLDAGAGYSVYQWSTGGNGQTINVNASGNYAVTVTDANGCTGSTNVNVTVNPLPTPAIAGLSAICQNDVAVLDAGAGHSSYLWSTGATTQTINTTAGGTYLVTVSNAFGCTATASHSLTVNALPAPVIAGVTSICQGFSTVLDAGSFSAYQWSNGSSSQTISVSTAGNYAVTVTDANGCTGNTSVNVIVNQNPVPQISGITTLCQGETTVLDAGNYSSYVWSTGDLTQTINTGTAGNYSVTVTDNNGCTGTTNVNITVNPLPVPAINGDLSICQGETSVLDAGSGFATYLWSDGSTSQTLTAAASGNYSVTVTNSFNCSASVSVSLVVNALPQPSIAGTTVLCDGDASVLDAGSGYATYSWSNGGTTQTINVNQQGNYSVLVTDNNGCTGTTSVNVVVNPLPTPSISGDNVICDGETTTFDAGAGYTNYVWSNGATTQAINIGSGSNYSVIVTDANGCTGAASYILTVYPLPQPAITGVTDICDGETATLNSGNGFANYLWSNGATTSAVIVNSTALYVVTVTDANGCKNSAQHQLNVHEYPVIAFEYDTSLICERFKVTFTNSSSFEPGSHFFWSFGDGQSSTSFSPSHYYPAAGTYNVVLAVTSPFGCDAKDSNDVTVVEHPWPVAKFDVDPDFVTLLNADVKFTDLSENAVSWLWNFGDGMISTDQNALHYFDAPGEYTIRLAVWNVAGCKDEISEEIYVTPVFIPNSFTPNSDGKNDLFYDSGYIVDVASYTMAIFNRWGQKVYETDSYEKPWDGTDRGGNLAPEGAYVYVVEVKTMNGRTHSFTSGVNLLR